MMELLGYTRVHQKRSWQQQQWEQQQLEQILEKCAEIQKRLEKYDQTNQEIKASRLEFPTFNGKDPDSWCYRAEQFFDFYEIPERRKLAITAFHIEGKASSWFRALRTTNECITWYEFVRAMRAQFSKAEEIILLDDDSKAKESIVENSMERVEESELVLKEFEPMELEKIHPVLEKLDTQVESLGFVDVKPKDVHNDASLPCEFASPVMDNSFFPSKVDEYGPSVVNQEGVMSSIYNTQTDSSEMKGNKQVSDDILAKIGSKVQPKEGLKLNPVRDFDEKSDSTIEMCLPDEDSLITFDDYCFLPDEDSLITGDDFRLPSDEKSLFSPSSQVHHTEKTSGLNVTHSHENSSQLHSEHPTADRISYGFVGLEPSNHTLAQQSYPQLHHTQPYAGQAFFHSLGSQTCLHPARNSTKAKTYPCSHSPHQFCSTSVLPSRFQQTHGEPTMFDHPVNHMLLQQMSIPHILPPRQLNGHPRGVMPDFPVNQIACYRQELNPMQDFYPTYEQPNFVGLGMPNQYFIDPCVARDDNHRKFNALFGEELRASFPGSGRGRSSLGNQVDIGFWYEQ